MIRQLPPAAIRIETTSRKLRKMYHRHWLKLCAAILLPGISLFCGCRAVPAEKIVMIPERIVPEMKSGENDEFDLTWLNSDEVRKFHKVKLETSFAATQLENSWWDEMNIVHLFYDDETQRQNVTDYAARSFSEALAASRHWQATEVVDSETMTLHFVIVQIIPNKPCFGALSNLSSLTPFGAMAIPLKMTLHSVNPTAGGAIAAEVVMTGGNDAELIGAMADKAKAPTAIFSIRAFTPYANIEHIIDCWSETIVTGLDSIHEGEEARFLTNPGFAFIN